MYEDTCCVIILYYTDLKRQTNCMTLKQNNNNNKKLTYRRSNFALGTSITRASSQALLQKERKELESSLCDHVALWETL